MIHQRGKSGRSSSASGCTRVGNQSRSSFIIAPMLDTHGTLDSNSVVSGAARSRHFPSTTRSVPWPSPAKGPGWERGRPLPPTQALFDLDRAFKNWWKNPPISVGQLGERPGSMKGSVSRTPRSGAEAHLGPSALPKLASWAEWVSIRFWSA